MAASPGTRLRAHVVSTFSVVAFGLTTLGCSAGDAAPRVISVPGDAATIQEAVDRAHAGDLVLIEPGTYSESVVVEQEGIVIRGVDRNEVILDGADSLPNGFEVIADSVAIENLTVRSFTQNGIVFNGAAVAAAQGETSSGYRQLPGIDDAVVDGYRVSYVTAVNNGLYGVYAFSARNGIIEYSYASGHPDSGFYVGQCKPCNAVLRHVVAERNAIGYFGTNASDGVFVVESVFRHNRLGIAPNSQDAEFLAPQQATVVAANLVADNDDPSAPAIPEGFFAAGIAVGGGTKNSIIGNRVVGHDGAGIIVMTMGRYLPENNVIRGNVFADNAVDLVYAVEDGSAHGNCFADHPAAITRPADLEILMPCDGAGTNAIAATGFRLPVAPPNVDHRAIPNPGPQESMTDARTAPVVIPRGVPPTPDLNTLKVPAR